MTDLPHRALLPDGLHDVLPPDAAHEARVVANLVAVFESFGYERVKPPLVEFEDTLLAGSGAGLAGSSFRLMDPISQRMMALRADMTVQVARIAGFRLARMPRPLRLCYAGQVLIVRGDQLRPERQISQAGAELIGASTPQADAEIAGLGIEALRRAGVAGLSLDLNTPPLVPLLLDDLGIEGADRAALRQALDRKDMAAAAACGEPARTLLTALIGAAGTLPHCRGRVAGLALPARVRGLLDRLFGVADLVKGRFPDLMITVDPLEHRGFEYHDGVSFVLFAPDVRGPLGRGGRYDAPHADLGVETATGLTLFMDSILRAVPAAPAAARVFLPLGTNPEDASHLRSQGWSTVAALDDEHAEEMAERLGCTHIFGPEGPVRRGGHR